jgi:hypothetical protein
MPVDFSHAIRTEDIQREALLILFDNLNDKIDELEEEWTNKDTDLYDRMGRVAPGWSVEHIPIENFLPGTLSPLMSRPIEEFPNVATIAYIARPRGTADDQGEGYQIRLAIETMVKSEMSEQEVNSRIKKTLEAIQLTFFDSWENRTLNHKIHELPYPQETTGDVFAIRKDNRKWFWQGGSFEYLLSKYASGNE